MSTLLKRFRNKSIIVMQPHETLELRGDASHTKDLEDFGTLTGDYIRFEQTAVLFALAVRLPSLPYGTPSVEQVLSIRPPVASAQPPRPLAEHYLDPKHSLHHYYRQVIPTDAGIVRRHFIGGLRNALIYRGEFLVASEQPEHGWILSPLQKRILDGKLSSPKYAR